MSVGISDTIAPGEFLAPRRQHFARLARRIFLRIVSAPKLHSIGTLHLTETFSGTPVTRIIGEGALIAEMTVKDRGTYAAIVFGGSRGMGRSYVNGLWETNDLSSLVRYLFRASNPLRHRQDRRARRLRALYGFAPFQWRLVTSALFRYRDTKRADRKNIHAHYDLSNEFFELMLDETLAYSCAVFKDESTSLYDAQVEKFDRLCQKLGLESGDHVIEIGTGWGGFALHAAKHYGAKVTTTTISENQRRVAQRRVDDESLGHLVTVIGEHYRDLTGTYDALVSVEMIEAVHWRHYRDFFSKCSTLLNDKGRMALQAITISDQSFDRAKLRDDFIRDLIFPGGCLPSVTAIMDSVASHTDLKLTDLDDIGLHYARTLRYWGKNVEERFDQIRELGFDDRFKRLWDMYLKYCEGAFLERHISDVQMIFHKPSTLMNLGYRAG